MDSVAYSTFCCHPGLRCLLAGLLLAVTSGCASTQGIGKGGTSTSSLREALLQPVPQRVLADSDKEHQEILTQGLFYPDRHPEVQRVQTILDRLSRVSFKPDLRLVAHVIQDPSENAFVTGGRHVYVFDGLLRNVTSDDELAGILGHEISHIDAGHRSRTEFTRMMTTGTVFVSDMLTSNTGDPQLASLLKLAALLVKSTYSQALEEEADVLGVRLANLAGYDAAQVSEFHKRSLFYFNERRRQFEQAKQQLDQQKSQYCPSLTENVASIFGGKKPSAAQQARCVQVSGDVQKEKLKLSIQEKLEGRLLSHPNPKNRLEIVAAADGYYGPPFQVPYGSILFDTNVKVAEVIDEIYADAKLGLVEANTPEYPGGAVPTVAEPGVAVRYETQPRVSAPGPDYRLREAQVRLNDLNYSCGAPDGRMGPRTAECIRRFQRDFGLPQTGELSSDVLEKLGLRDQL